MKLKTIRWAKGLTQEEAASLLGITRRTYAKYENDESRWYDLKYKFMCQVLEQYGYVDEEHGLLSIEKIKEVCVSIFKEYNIECAYLVGSYAKGEENETSNVDIFVLVREDNFNLDEMVEILRENLKKKINLLDILNLKNNIDLVQDVLRDGIKIYVHGEK